MYVSAQMIHPGHRLFAIVGLGIMALCAALASPSAGAQANVATPPEEREALTPAELQELAGPIALYPDDLVSIVLPASTYPLQIVQAARFLEAHETDSSLEPDENWDDSVVALLNYPEVVQLLNEDLDWTWTLGEAALYQQAGLLDAIQAFRDRAYAAGNLRSDERQTVRRDEEDTIVIEPADPKVIYVPYYEPRQVIIRHTYPAYHYYPHAYPVYYYPYAYSYGYPFKSGFFWGITTAFSIGWHSHYVNVHHHHHHSHPYYGRYYHYPWYRRHSVSASYGGHIWRPGHHSGARQRHAAAVTRTNRDLGATSSSRGRMRNQPANTEPRIRRPRHQPGADAQRQTRTAAVTEQAVTRARTAARLGRVVNPREAGPRARGSDSRYRRAARAPENPRNQATASQRRAPRTFGGLSSRQGQILRAQREATPRGGYAQRTAQSHGGDTNRTTHRGTGMERAHGGSRGRTRNQR